MLDWLMNVWLIVLCMVLMWLISDVLDMEVGEVLRDGGVEVMGLVIVGFLFGLVGGCGCVGW